MSAFKSFLKTSRFDDLSKAVQHCSLCPRLHRRSKVLTSLNGNIDSKVFFIAEAPGRLGADRTCIPLYGDRTGEIFESLISNIGWERDQIFISNSILCNPREENGKNDTPTKEEIFNCSVYLEMTIELIQPDVVVPLGKTALDSLALISPHLLTLKSDVGKLVPWNRRYIFPLYHPGPRALIHRPLIKQQSDYLLLLKKVDPLEGLRVKKAGKQSRLFDLTPISKTRLQELVLIFLKQFQEVSLFKLMKLIYLADIMALKKTGRTLSNEIYLRQHEGPWIPALRKSLDLMKGYDVEIFFKKNTPHILRGPMYNLEISLNEDEIAVIKEVIDRYVKMSDARIKSTTYLTEPMRYILRQEKKGRNMRNKPVIYKNKTIIEIEKSKPVG